MRAKVPAVLFVALCLLVAVPAGTGAVTAASTAQSATTPGPTSGPADADPAAGVAGDGQATESPPPDPDEDVLGWENGRWYNESVDVDASDGLDRNESARLLNRTMARVELVRGVEFEEPVDLNFRTRSEVASLFGGNVSQYVSPQGLNAKYEALGFAGEDRDAVDVLREKQGGSTAAFVANAEIPELDIQPGDVTIVLDDGQTTFSEVTLAHERVHTLQVQELAFPYRTNVSAIGSTDSFNARRSVVEGEASHAGYLYAQRCDGEWDCVTPQPGGGPGLSDAARALLFMDLVRYGNGGEFVAELREAGGWDAVVDTYDDLPASTEQVIHPEKYRADQPEAVTVPDRSGEAWRPLPEAADTVGEAGLFTMLWFPGFVSRSTVVMEPFAGINRSVRSQFVVDYDHEATAGWDGDRLVPYVSDSADANETGFVWRTQWDSAAAATEFRDAYLSLLSYRGADAVDGRQNTYRIPDDSPFGDAFYVVQNGSSVLVVNGPTVADLSAVHEGAAPEAATATPTPTPTPAPTATAAPTTTSAPTSTPTATATDAPTATTAGETTAGSGPGVGALGALVAVLTGVALVVRRRR